MPRNSDVREKLRRMGPVGAARAALGTLVVLNLAATWMVYNPPGGSVSSLSADMTATQQQIARKRAAVAKLHAIVDKVRTARAATEKFESQYFLTRRTYASTVVEELGRSAKAAGIREREKSYNVEAIEGTDNLELLTINANYEGNYADLVQFVSMVDRSDRLLVLESLQAQPQSAGQGLGIQVKLNAIVREDGSVATTLLPKPVAASEPVKTEAAAPAPPPVEVAPMPAPVAATPVARPPQMLPPGFTSRSADPMQGSPKRPPPVRGPRRKAGSEEVEK
jgi:Tfp pilus assembly protein PilO